MRRTTKPAPARRLGLQTLRGTWQRLSMVLLLMMLTTMTAWAQGVAYIDANGVVKNTATDDIVGNDNPTVLTGGEGETKLSAGWYVVDSDITYTGTVTLEGDVTIILCDGKTMNIGTSESVVTGSGINGSGHNLTIYGQTLDESTAGQLRIYMSSSYSSDAGILIFPGTGTYTQHSGNVTINSYGNAIFVSGNISINGGKLDATASTPWIWVSSKDVFALAGSSNITMTGGILNATGNQDNGANSAYGIACTTFTLGWRNASDRFTASSFALGTVTIADGQAFTDEDGNIYSGTLSSDDKKAIAGKMLQPVLADILTDNASNTTIIQNLADGQPHDIMLLGRTLYKDGKWNTLCLPFNVSDGNDTDELTFSGTPLEGATVKTLTSASFDNSNGTLTLNFTEDANNLTEIVAGTPYIVKWASGNKIENPTFSDVTIRATAPTDITPTGSDGDGSVTFKGVFKSVTIGDEDGGDKSKLYLGSENNLYWPSSERTINAFRAYFQLNGLTAGEPDPTGDGSGFNVRAFNLNFGEDDATGIVSTTNYTNYTNSAGAGWYDLSGRKLQDKPTAKGLYINNGKKVVIK